MAQGSFRRTGSTFSQKSSNDKRSASKAVRKGARVITPKRAAAQARAQITAKLTASLNRRAESALIGRIGHEESSLRMIKADASVLEELNKKKQKSKETGKGKGSKAEKDEEEKANKTSSAVASNGLIKNAIEALDNDAVASVHSGDSEDEEEEVFTEDEAIPMSSDESEVEEAEK